MSFESLGLAPALLRALAEQGYAQPTPIQAAAIPIVLEGSDLLAAAQTGTGKNGRICAAAAAAHLPMVHAGARNRRPRALVLTPTRELAAQVHDNLREYGKHLRITSATIFGGVGMGPQVQALRRGVDVVIATPGRLIDHMQRAPLDLSGIEVLVLDEADRMFDMGFLPDIRRLLRYRAGQAADPAVLGHHARRRRQAGARNSARPADGAGEHLQPRCHHHARAVSRSMHRQDPAAAGAAGRTTAPLDAGVRAHQAPRRKLAEQPQKCRLRAAAFRATCPRTAACTRMAGFRDGSYRSWLPPTSPRAASISTSCRS